MIVFDIHKNIVSHYKEHENNFIILIMDNFGYLYKMIINVDETIYNFIIHSIYNINNLTLYIEEIRNIIFFKLKFNSLRL